MFQTVVLFRTFLGLYQCPSSCSFDVKFRKFAGHLFSLTVTSLSSEMDSASAHSVYSNACKFCRLDFLLPEILISSSISTQILSHHVDDFTLVAAFFLFSIGCLNMFLGLVFRESAKQKRSITSWRAEAKGILPTHQDSRPVFTRPSAATVQRSFSMEKDRPDTEEFGTWKSTEKVGFGFGRQGEKAAGLRGQLILPSIERCC